MSRWRSLRTDVIVSVVLFVGAAVWGAATYTRAFSTNHRPFFYQSYFEPAVMTACGKGFLIAQPQPAPAALRAFLNEERDRFSCDELPRGLQVGTAGLYQRPWRYLLTMVALAWRVLGISWSGLSPLFGVLFGASAVLAYALCRTLVGPVAAAVTAGVLCISPLQLTNLPNLRDYAKAPFTLALLAILIALVTQPRRRRAVLLLALAYGIVMGIGYGFRTDLLIDIPPFVVAVLLFLPGGLLNNGWLKLGSIACFAAAFVVTGWPIISTVMTSGGCQWHVALLGLAAPFNDALGVNGGSYGWGHLYNDQYVWANVSNYATRFRPDLGYIEYCSHEYDVASWEYYRRILTTFPADMATRAYASVIHVLNLPFDRLRILPLAGTVLAAIFAVASGSTGARRALFAVFAIVYFAGYPAIQFLPRHYFPFEVIGWLLLAWTIEGLVRRAGVSGIRAGLAWATVALVALAAPLWLLRIYQQRQVTTLLHAYQVAATVPLPLETIGAGRLRLAAAAGPRPTQTEVVADLGRARARFVEIAVASDACRPGTSITFRYDPTYPDTDFTRTVLVPAGSREGTVRLFEPVYDTFVGLDVSDPSCAMDVTTVRDVNRFPLMLSVQLTPDWASLRQYQQLSGLR